MSLNFKSIVSDVARAGIVVASALLIVLGIVSGLNVPSEYVAWVSIAAGVLNGIIGVLKPHVVNFVKGKL